MLWHMTCDWRHITVDNPAFTVKGKLGLTVLQSRTTCYSLNIPTAEPTAILVLKNMLLNSPICCHLADLHVVFDVQ